MMKNQKLLSLLLAGTMTLSLAACSGGKTAETTALTQAAETKAAEETKAPEATAAPVADGAAYVGEHTDPDSGSVAMDIAGGENGITKEMAYEGVNKYCHSEYDWSVAKENPSIMYVAMGDETESEYKVIFRSYTGAFVYFYVDKSTGTTRMTEYVPTLVAENEMGTIELFDYLEKKD